MKRPQSFAALLLIARFVALSDCLTADLLDRKATIPAPISVAAAQNWDGVDGSWSSFAFQVGTPSQTVRLFISTALHQTSVVLPEGCVSTDPTNCAGLRGGEFLRNTSTTWEINKANLSSNIYDLTLGQNTELGYSGKALFGFDDITIGWQGAGGPTLKNETVAGIAAKDTYLGLFGLMPRGSNFTSFNDPIPSFLQNLRNKSMVPSLAWAYTAGNQYRLSEVWGSLTLGGYDRSKFNSHDMTWSFDSHDVRDLTVQITGITSADKTGETSLLPTSIPAFLDSGLPYIWLPEEACALFEKAFNLTWDNATELYTLTDIQHKALLTQSPNITFTLGNLTAGFTTNISLPYAAFDLVAQYPLVTNTTRYFPLKRAANATQHTLGRVFFQEAYVIADYDRGNFSVSQCKWVANSQQDIVPILSPSLAAVAGSGSNTTTTDDSNSKKSSTPIAPIVGGVVGGLVVIAAAYLIFRYCIRPRRRAAEAATAAALAANEEKHDPVPRSDVEPAFSKPELDSNTPTPAFEMASDKNQWHVEADSNPTRIYEMPASNYFEMPGGEVASELRGEGFVPEVSESVPQPPKHFSYMQTPIEMNRNPNARWSWITSPGGDTLRGSEKGSFREQVRDMPSPGSGRIAVSPQSAQTPMHSEELRDGIVSPQSANMPLMGDRRF